jgi:hypothetical protein
MLIAVFGTPSPLTYWMSFIARTISDTLYGSHLFITPTSIDDLNAAWAERNGRAVVMQSETPQREVIDIFIDIGAPMYIVADNPIDVAIYTQTSRGIDVRSALRVASQSFSILSDLHAYGNVELIDAAWYGLTLQALLERFVRRLGINVSESQKDEVLKRIYGEVGASEPDSVLPLILRKDPLARPPGAYSAPGGEREETIIKEVIPQYGNLLRSRSRKIPIVWPKEIFPDRDDLGRILDGARPMLGPARILLGGHTLHLPSGEWIAHVDIEVTKNHSGNRLLSQVYCGENLLQTVSAKLSVKGRFVYDMTFSVYDGFFPVQVLVAIAEGAIEGEITLHSCEFRLKGSESVPTIQLGETRK